MKLYIAAHSQEEAKKVASILVEKGYATINSSWLNEDFSRTSTYTENERLLIACKDAQEVSESDALVLLASPYRVPGGKFVEVGVAIGLGKPVYIIGHRENMLMWHSLTHQFNSAEDLAKHIVKLACQEN